MKKTKKEFKDIISSFIEYNTKRSMLRLCVYNTEWWNKHIGDPKLFINKMIAEGIY